VVSNNTGTITTIDKETTENIQRDELTSIFVAAAAAKNDNKGDNDDDGDNNVARVMSAGANHKRSSYWEKN
jgi:hypothetical protein